MRKYLWTLLSVMALLTACSDSKQTTGKNPYYPEEADEDTAFVTLEEAAGDSMLVGSSLYSTTERELEVMAYQAEEIKSTYMLQLMLSTYEQDLIRAEQKVREAEQSGQCSDAEVETLHATLDYIRGTMDLKMRQYTLPASGVIGALHSTQKAVNNAKTREEFETVMSNCSGYFQTLPTLHLIVQEPSKQREVHRLAKELQRTVERRRAELK